MNGSTFLNPSTFYPKTGYIKTVKIGQHPDCNAGQSFESCPLKP